ncbi:MAG: hypothetical protein ABFD79_09395 [Phycisphaerales bacterium]
MFNVKKTENLIKEYLHAKKNAAIFSTSMDKKILSDSLDAYEKSNISTKSVHTNIYKYSVRAAVLIIIITGFIINHISKNNFYNEITFNIIQHTFSDKTGSVRINSNDGEFSIIFDNKGKKGYVIINQEKKYIPLKLPNITNKYLESFLEMSADYFQFDKVDNISLNDFERISIQINAETLMTNGKNINNFFASLIQYRNNGGVFPTQYNGSEFARLAWHFSNQNTPGGIANYLTNIEIVCP